MQRELSIVQSCVDVTLPEDIICFFMQLQHFDEMEVVFKQKIHEDTTWVGPKKQFFRLHYGFLDGLVVAEPFTLQKMIHISHEEILIIS